ncbi:uncharacterized protein LOC126838835 isoform X2 [Adelges cooleyi]|uniref:uncharacterized protein LOC126838835 isoform X2 n=1 Tax=Adelges cooleyi TaxID=133065 RepID=UPI00217FA89D|nr:uncharacterized protein LOC126838835 isoform X2 [Adelges cooleyi]
MYELVTQILECIDFISNTMKNELAEIFETWNQCSRVFAGVVEKIKVARRAPLDTDLLNEFPDIRTKVATKLVGLETEQLGILEICLKRFSRINECLKNKLDRINNKLEKISFKNHMELKHTIHEHALWIEDCWSCFHVFYMQLQFAMMSLKPSDEESAGKLVEAIIQNEQDKYTIGRAKMYLHSWDRLI